MPTTRTSTSAGTRIRLMWRAAQSTPHLPWSPPGCARCTSATSSMPPTPGANFSPCWPPSTTRVSPWPRSPRVRIPRESYAGPVKSWSCTSRAFIPISLCRFPPLAKGPHVFPPLARGGLGGVGPARPVTRSSHALSLSVLSHPSREARRIVLDCQGSRITPPAPPLRKGGGERDRSLTTLFHPAQQKYASRNRPSSSVNTNFSPAQGKGVVFLTVGATLAILSP